MTFVAAQAFSGVHVFPFSRREGTAAYYLPEQIPRQVKQDRSRRLIRLAEELGQAFLQQFPVVPSGYWWRSTRRPGSVKGSPSTTLGPD